MGLAERRAVTAFQEGKFPEIKKQIDGVAGFDVPMEIKWETLGSEGYSTSYEEFFPKVYFQPLINAFKAICVDQMGKDSLKKGLKKIVIKNEGGNYSAGKAITFDGGILTIDHEPHSNVDDVQDRTKGLQTKLENSL